MNLKDPLHLELDEDKKRHLWRMWELSFIITGVLLAVLLVAIYLQ
jgi:hypothetical protein